MSKTIKQLITDQLKSRYGTIENAVWVEFVGVDGAASNEFRRSLRSRNMRMQMVKTALFRRAVSGSKLDKLGGAACGSVSIITGGESATAAAKVIEEWMPRIKGLKLRAAVLEGEFISESMVQGLAKMPGKRDLQGRILSIALLPGSRLLSAINSGGGNVLGCVKSLIEKLEKAPA